MKVRLNGEEREFPDEAELLLEELLRRCGLPGRGLLVEHNLLALNRSEWEGRMVRDGDRLEALRVAAGG